MKDVDSVRPCVSAKVTCQRHCPCKLPYVYMHNRSKKRSTSNGLIHP
jgi:hypothetical protein